jgi:quercetin dioxygenase-like cupin family protein
MNLDLLKSLVKVNAYHITSEKEVPLHRHSDNDEIFYCIKGEGYGLLESGEKQELTPGKAFIVPAGVKHSVRSDSEIFVCSILVPKTK